MLKKITLGAALAASTLAVAPAAAVAHDGGYYSRDGYYGRSYQRPYRRCSGTTGTIIGGALGALAGRAIDKSSCRNDRGYRGY